MRRLSYCGLLIIEGASRPGSVLITAESQTDCYISDSFRFRILKPLFLVFSFRIITGYIWKVLWRLNPNEIVVYLRNGDLSIDYSSLSGGVCPLSDWEDAMLSQSDEWTDLIPEMSTALMSTVSTPDLA